MVTVTPHRTAELEIRIKNPEASAKAMAWIKAHPDRARETSRRYREKHKEAIKAKRAADYQADKEKFNARTKAWTAANPSKARVIRRRAKRVKRARKIRSGLRQFADLAAKLQPSTVRP